MPNTLNPMQMQMMGYMNAPPDIQAGASEIFKQQQLADLLRKQAIEPIKADEYSKTGSGQWAAPPQIVPVGIGQGLAKMGTALASGYMDKKASEDSLALANKLREAKQAHYRELFGSEAVPGQTTAPIGGQEAGTLYTDDYTAVPTADQQGYKTLDTPATPGLQGKDLARALAKSWMPEFEKAGLNMMTNPPKPQVHVLPKSGTLVGEDGKIIASGTPERIPPQFKEEYVNGPKGEPMVQKMVSLDNGQTWKQEGVASPRFARQVAPVIHVGTSKFSNVQPDGKGGWVGQDASGVMRQVPVEEGVIGKDGNVSLQGGRESVQNQRVMLAANQVANDAANIARMPLSADRGVFGGRSQEKSLFEAGKETLTNSMTTQDVQSYNVKIAGIQRNLAAIEAAGLMPSGSLTHQMDAVVAKSGDTNFTKMQKLAQIRQIVDSGLETLAANPRISEDQKKHMMSVGKKLSESIPYTHEDLDALQLAQAKNPKATLASIKSSKQSNAGPVVGTVQDGYKFKGGDPSKPESWEKM